MEANFTYRWEWLADEVKGTWKPYNDKLQTLLNDSVKNKRKMVRLF